MKKLLILALSVFALAACKKESPADVTPAVEAIPDNFDFRTNEDVNVDITLKDLQGQGLENIMISIFSPDGSERIYRGLTDANGDFNALIKVPKIYSDVLVRTSYVALSEQYLTSINSAQLSLDLGGVLGPRKKSVSAAMTIAKQSAGLNFYYIGALNKSTGVPFYLETPSDVISPALLNEVNTYLPEQQPVPLNSPLYLAAGNQTEIDVIANGEVWITYVAEGASYKNTLGYYTFPTNNPPTNASQIDSVFVIFPNFSQKNDGSNLLPGDKVKLGTFEAGTTIGWVLLANGWQGSNSQAYPALRTSGNRFYSDPSFNPESTSAKRQHNVQILDNVRKMIIVGFEDLQRETQNSDEDFNDAIFYLTANPWTAVSKSGFPVPVAQGDDDGDGVMNGNDDYPNDAERAFDNVYGGTLGFEDLWPATGDYDFNDLVMGYKTNIVTNADNDVKDINTRYTIRAVGGNLTHGFGVQYDGILPSNVASSAGSKLSTNLVSLASNNLEAGQTNAVQIVYDDVYSEMPRPAGNSFTNTLSGEQTTDTVSINMTMTLTSPQTTASIGGVPFNPFIFVRERRNHEIHLSDQKPTDLMDANLLGTIDDNSDAQQSRYYKSANNMPWGIHIEGNKYNYPQEYINISSAYLRFAGWANSGGSSFTDWYLDLSGNRDNSKIY